ncbi:hypothetical protein [Streptomyces sp. HNM0574]|uniref:hypothetical protein n=1 Tax=Streptomyces sp. HNM0574 TaxID=2714954 RepID=UPI00146DD26C|nr:hypothetical protein [Streptomyces sp. HNM0574]NLU69975.1 hypothetical protein [Streptomyces sp. HNM0574]
MPSRTSSKRSRTRRAGEGLFGVLLLAKALLMALIALMLVCAGLWTSWRAAEPAMFGERTGTVRIEDCGGDVCTGRYFPGDATGGAPPEERHEVTIGESVSGRPGETLEVALRPGTNEVVRRDMAGVLYAWVPFGGSLLLASLVVAGGLRMRRTAWSMGLLGAASMAAAWALLTF